MKLFLRYIRTIFPTTLSSATCDDRSQLAKSKTVLLRRKRLHFHSFTLALGISLGVSGIAAPSAVRAEGTKEITTDTAGSRPWFNSPVGGFPYQGINQKVIVNVYANAGETINVGSSAVGLGGTTITLTAPDGTVYTANGSGGIGVINNRTQEQAGPLPNLNGYTPYTQTVSATQTGIWQVRFFSQGSGNNGVLSNTANWTRAANQGTGALLAWDATVRSSGTAIPGRAYITNLGADMGNFYPTVLKSIFYVLTKDGHLYDVNTNTLAPNVFNFFSNNNGFTSAGNPTYQSLNAIPAVGTNVQDPYAADSGNAITNKMFLNTPASDLPAFGAYAGGSTWLSISPLTPFASNFVYTLNPLGGGTFTFNSNLTGTYSIEMDVNHNGSFTDAVDRRIQGLTLAGSNTVVWDGKNGAGTALSNVIAFPVRVSTRAGEVHFPITDAESNPSGFIITRINGVASGNSTIYWDDTKVKTGGTQNLAGAISNPGGAHPWGDTSANQSAAFGNDVGIDTWTFTRSAVVFVDVVKITGTVFYDADNSANGTFNNIQTNSEIGVNLTSLNAILVDSSNKVVATTPLATDGTYTFTDIAINQSNLKVLLSTTVGVAGSAPPAQSVPNTWANTSPLITTPINIVTSDVTQNFGIEQVPITTSVSSGLQSNPGGTIQVQVPTLAATDPEDGVLGTGKSFKIVTVPANGTLYYPNASNVPTVVTAGQVIANYDPTKLTLDPTATGADTVTFTYAAIDAAGKQGTTATVTMTFSNALSCNNVYATGYVASTFTINKSIYNLNGATMTSVFTGPQSIGILGVDGAGNATYDNGTSTGIVYKYNGTAQSNTGRTWSNVNTGHGVDSAGNIYYVSSNFHLMKIAVGGSGGPTDLGLITADATFSTLLAGDVAVDGNGRIYVYSAVGINGNSSGRSYLYSVDANTLKATNLGNIGPDGATGMAFKGNTSTIVTTSGSAVYNIDLGAASLTGTSLGNSSIPIYDLGSCGAPLLNPKFTQIDTTKSVSNITKNQIPAVNAAAGDVLEYTIQTTNSGNVSSGNTVLTDAIPTGTTYVAGTTALNGTAVTDVGSKMPYDPTSTFSHEIHSANQPVGTVLVGASNKAVVKFRVKVGNTGLPATIDNIAQVQYPTVAGGITTTQILNTPIVITPITSNANVLLVKRITAINGLSTNPNDNTSLTGLLVDPNWKAGYVVGAIDGGKVKPGDTIEYTIYYLNNGGRNAKSVRICDRLNANQTFYPDTYPDSTFIQNNTTNPNTAGSGMQVQKGMNAALTLTNTSDSDGGQFIAATGTALPTDCKSVAGAPNNDYGALILDLVTNPGSPNLTTLPGKTSQGAPNDSFGFWRFITKVNKVSP
jgi:uncharacterized repeat protein (TIGR01451 family)